MQMTAMVMIGVAGVAAWFSSFAARSPLTRLARATQVASRARRHLREVLRDHHDVRTLLGTARVNLDLLLSDAPTEAARKRAARAAGAVAAIGEMLDGIRLRTLGELVSSDELGAVELSTVATRTVRVVCERFPAVTISVEAQQPRVTVVLFGGERALVHILLNLLVNACEGDGRQGARAIDLTFGLDRDRPRFVKIEVVDDGPGFGHDLLESDLALGCSSKPSGGGLGLELVRSLVEASGGLLSIGNRSEPGARATVWLHASRIQGIATI